ncbi:hypothetical protein PRIPAC_87915 [Pristionchus pacificus]|nr:hypothetical protein PRIPAC_87915 [Pristionchus pacificus]
MMITYAKLTSMDEKSTQFSIVLGMMLVMWNDPRLIWNPQQFNNITHLYTTLQQIWFPNFHPCESLTARFPFDRQSCLLCFALNGYDPGDVSFKAWNDPPALSADMSEWRVQINNETSSFDYCAHDLCMTLHYSIILSRNPEFWVGMIFMLGFLILIGLFFSGKENLVNNAINFGLTTMMSMMVVVGILNDSLSKIESIPSMGLFVLIQIAVTSVAVLAALVSDKIHTALWRSARRKNRDASRWWRPTLRRRSLCAPNDHHSTASSIRKGEYVCVNHYYTASDKI